MSLVAGTTAKDIMDMVLVGGDPVENDVFSFPRDLS
jgi:(2Fe-2S) ferredoxin